MSRAASAAPAKLDPAAAGRDAHSALVVSAPLRLSEIRMLAAGLRMRATCIGLGRGGEQVLLDEAERARRLADLERLWTGGCRRAVDEVLFRDIAARHPQLAVALRARLRRRQSSSSAGTGIGRP
ncbi:hypothetical protein [Stappia indica]|uniref:hypothetical protein n=1 Tax=Stappia indica TaxID=538381 RepID=UPI00082AC82B|nr:hypothetical protein [Stappia indica]